MIVTIYHNPRCSKSRQVLEIIQNASISPIIIEYLKYPLTLDELISLFESLNIDHAISMIRSKESEFKEMGLTKDSSNIELLAGIAKSPKLLERPIVVTNKGARICRPPNIIHEIL